MVSMPEERHRHQEWLKFLCVIDQVTPAEEQIHLIADNYATHKLGIPAKANADSEGNANGIPGRRRTVLGA